MKGIKIILFVLTFSIVSCKSESKLSGNYSTCFDGLYAELYIVNDSIRMATSLDYLSDWRNFEIKNDTFYHTTFGERADSTKARINYVGKNEFVLNYKMDSVSHTFKKMTIDIDENMTLEIFWNEFYERRKKADCYTK